MAVVFSWSFVYFSQRHIGLGGEGQYIGDKTSPTAERIQEEEMLESCESQPPVQDLYPLSHKLAREMGVKPDRLQVQHSVAVRINVFFSC